MAGTSRIGLSAISLLLLAAGSLVTVLAAPARADEIPRPGDFDDGGPDEADAAGDGGAAGVADAEPQTLDAAPPPPKGIEQKSHLREDDYESKKEGGYFTGLPLANYDPATQVGFGARLYYFYDGYRSDPLFAYTPYLHRLILQGFVSTAGAQDQLIDYDAPNFLGSLFRVRATFEYEAANAWPYFGIGSRSLSPLTFPGAPGQQFKRLSDFDKAKEGVQPDGTNFVDYNLIAFKRPQLQLGLERLFFGGVLRPFVGLGFTYVDVHDLTGEIEDGVRQAPTLLARDCAAGAILGCGGGFDNVLRLAVSFDTRDFEPDPNSGVYAEFSNEIATRALGSQYEYLRTMLSVRGFYSPIPKLADVVLAGRAVYEIQTKGVPFFSSATMPFIDDNHVGLGGFRTLRGFSQNRFVGPVIGLANAEVRWTFVHFRLLKQNFALIAAPFMDIGRVFDDVKQTTLAHWQRTQGGGLRIAWNEATIIMADYGFSDEGGALYINFNHIF